MPVFDDTISSGLQYPVKYRKPLIFCHLPVITSSRVHKCAAHIFSLPEISSDYEDGKEKSHYHSDGHIEIEYPVKLHQTGEDKYCKRTCYSKYLYLFVFSSENFLIIVQSITVVDPNVQIRSTMLKNPLKAGV